jgi:hypothetical protein
VDSALRNAHGPGNSDVWLLADSRSSRPQGAQQQAAEKPKLIEVEKLQDNLFVLRGGGGNTAVFITADGVVLVDSKLPRWGAPVLAKVKELTPKPVTTIINICVTVRTS